MPARARTVHAAELCPSLITLYARVLAESLNYTAPAGGAQGAAGLVIFIVAMVLITGSALLALLLMVDICFKCACILPNDNPEPFPVYILCFAKSQSVKLS